ncbi:MAG: UDP-N-acetylmuramoyl-L-alanine--D-glutamate ligase [Candidatus Cloacimonetes bacterium]|nr:UDP-N-acetylmuramoyl-L-alanine--D-glutamate ligase [Candidatus Cloacimonadota bacterium]
MELNNIAILGLARSGIAAAYKIKSMNGAPFLSEFRKQNKVKDSTSLIRDFDCEFGGHTDRLFDFKTIIVSPGIPLLIPIIKKLKKNGNELISEIEFGFRIKNSDSKIIAVTGSNGKSTTVSLIHHFLKSAGFNSILAGNIGEAFTSFAIEKPGFDFIVLELSSFQLDLIKSFQADISAILNITPDHLNRYNSFDDYALSKFKIFQNNIENSIAIINSDDEVISKKIDEIKGSIKKFSMETKTDMYFDSENIRFGNNSYNLKKSKLIGQHNIQNIMAAILSTSDFIDDKNLYQNAINTFSPLSHRMEFCKKINGISFINDSKATNTDSVKFALKSFSNPVRIILGGSDKGEDFSILKPLLHKHSCKIYLIGETRNTMKNLFEKEHRIELFENLADCVIKAYKDAKNGDIVLLSPACASYDMFINFEDRGNKFKEIVKNLDEK